MNRPSDNQKKPRLLVIQDPSGTEKGKEYIIDNKISLGRLQGNDIQLKDSKASRRHASIEFKEDNYYVKDLKSGNGTYVNNVQIQEAPIQDKDLLRIGDTHFMFRNAYNYAPPTPAQAVLKEASSLEKTKAELRYDSQRSFLMNAKELNTMVEVEKANTKLRTLYEVNNAISSTLEQDKLLSIILDTVFRYIPASRGAILLYDEKANPDNPLQIAVTKVAEKEKSETPISISRTLMEKVVRERTSICAQDISLDASLKNVHSLVSQGTRSTMSVPLISKENLLGVLHVDTTEKTSEFNEDALELLTAIAGQAAIAIENAKLLKDIEKETRTRGHLQRYLAPELVEQVVNDQLDMNTGGEVKKATILFTDLRGFTSMTENIGAEAVVSILNDYFTRMVDIVFSTTGTLDKFIGDAIMAIWGLPVSHKEDAYLAVKAAIEMQTELFYFNVKQKKTGKNTLKMGAGINTGNVVVGNMGSPKRMEYTVIGPDVNLASRVEHLTTRNQVLITDNSFYEAQDLIKCVELEPTRVKGINRDIQVYGVVAVKNPTVTTIGEETVRVTGSTYSKFLPILLKDPNDPSQEYEGLLQHLNSKQTTFDLELVDDNILRNATTTFYIDMPKIIPDEEIQIRIHEVGVQTHNDDEHLQVVAEVLHYPTRIQTFFEKLFHED